MNHAKKRYKNGLDLNPKEEIEFRDKFIQVPFYSPKQIQIPKGKSVFVRTEIGNLLEAFYYNNNGRHYYIPEPDPILIYFDHAHAHFRVIEKNKEILFTILESNDITENIANDLYRHFGICNGFAIFMFMSIEAFINRLIKDDYIHIDKKGKKNDKSAIEFMRFKDKLKIVAEIEGKDFLLDYPDKYMHIERLKQLRDDTAHTKYIKSKNTEITYSHIYKMYLNFDYHNAFFAIVDFMNYYIPEYIEECKCGAVF